MSPFWGFVGGAMGIALLDAAVGSPATSNGQTVASGDLSGAFGLLQKFLQIVIDPTRPAIANHAAASSGSSSPSPASTAGGTAAVKAQEKATGTTPSKVTWNPKTGTFTSTPSGVAP